MNTITLFKSEFKAIHAYNDTYFFRHDAEELNEGSDMVTAQEEVVVVPHATYNTLVSALIHTKYSIDDELALLANHAEDPTDADHLAEFTAYQAWRDKVKEACQEYFNAV